MNRRQLERAFAKALRELDPAARVSAALARWSPSPSSSPVRVVAIGKAAAAMATGAVASLGDAVERCLVVAPDGSDTSALEVAARRARVSDRVEVMRAAHPLPDARSVRAGDACLSLVTEADLRARIVVLVSGGASALACAPATGITLRTKRAITRAMLESGASIQDVNIVRKHLSRLKGGGLARAAAERSLLTLVASDVIGGTATDVGSGPSVPDGSTVAEARRLLERFVPAFANVPLARTSGPASSMTRSRAGASRDAFPEANVILSPEELARSLAALLRDEARVVRVLPPSQAPVAVLAAEYLGLVARVLSTSRAHVFVRAAEPSVSVTTRGGRGGRSTHLAALVGHALGARKGDDGRHEPPRVCFAAIASDGVDGTSETGGAVIDDLFARRATSLLGDAALSRALARFDTGPLHRALGTAITAGATGHNLADVHVLLVG